MTVAAVTPRITYNENGSTTAFAVPFQFIAAADLVVTRIDSVGGRALASLGADYSVSGGDFAAGSVTMFAARGAGARLEIRRSTPQTQPMDYTPTDTFPAETHEHALDRVTMIAQEISATIDDDASRALRVPIGETAAALPVAASRASKLLTFDAAGNPIVASLLTLLAGTVLAVTSASGASVATRGLLAGIVSPVANQTAYLAEPGREGWFRFSTSSLAAKVTLDTPTQGIYVAPSSDTTGASGAWVRVDTALTPAMFGLAGGSGFLAAQVIAASDGKTVPFLQAVATAPQAGVYALPSGFNDQIGGTKPIFDGKEWRFQRSRFSAIDFVFSRALTHHYVDFVAGLDTYDGTVAVFTTGTTGPFKTYGKAGTTIAAAAAGSAHVIHLLNGSVGFNSEGSAGGGIGAFAFADGKYVKIISEAPGGKTRFAEMKEDKDMATLNWQAHGAGAWKSNVAGAVGQFVAQFWLGNIDALGLPQPIVSTGQNATSVGTTELTSFWDGTWLYVHLPDGAKPDPFNNWLYCNNVGNREYHLDTGTLLFENIEFFGGAAGVAANAFRFRSTSDAATVTTAKIGFRKCGFYGASGNGLGVFDPGILVTEQCYGGYCFNDLFNVHSFNLTVAKGAAITWYSDRDQGHDAGYAGFAWGLAASGSDNAFTAHDGCSAIIAGSRGWSVKDAAFAFVGGSDIALYGCIAPPNGTGAGSFYNSAFIYEANTGDGTHRRMTMVGCDGTASAGSYAIQISGSATDGVILIGNWQGAADVPLYAWTAGSPGANSAGAIRALNDNSLLYKAA